MSDIYAVEKKISSEADADDIDLADLGRKLWQGRRLIFAATLTTTVLALSLSFVLPKTYQAETSILPMQEGGLSSGLSAMLATQLGPAAAMLGGMGSGKTEDLVDILESRTMAEHVIAADHLAQKLKGWKYPEDLVKKVRKMTFIVPPGLKSKTIVIKVNANDPALAALMANTYVSELKGMLDDIGYNRAARNRKFIGGQLASTKTELTVAENKLARFQATTHLADLPDTVNAAIKSLSALDAQKVNAEVQLKATTEVMAELKDKVGILQADPNDLTQLEVKQKTLEAQQDAIATAEAKFTNTLANLPPQGMALARLERDLKVQEAIYLALTQQFENARIEENKESDAFVPLDIAQESSRAVRPRKALWGIMGMVLGLLFSGIVVLRTAHSIRSL